MRRNPISRRTMLRGMLAGSAVGIGLPMLEVFLDQRPAAHAQGGFPKRWALFFWGNGNIPELWAPDNTGPNWKASPNIVPGHQLYPLVEAGVADDVTVLTGMKVMTQSTNAHSSGASGIFTGTSLNNGAFPSESFDQMVARKIGTETLYQSLQTSCEVTNAAALTGPSWSFKDANTQNPSNASVHDLFNKLFGPTFVEPGGTPIIDPKNALRRSVLDVVGDDITRLRRRVGTADRARLDQHLSSIRGIELQLARLEANPPSFASCHRPGEPPLSFPLDIAGRIAIEEINQAFCNVIAMAFACDLTRVVSHYLTGSVSGVRFPGFEAGHHQLTHDEPGDQPLCQQVVRDVMTYYSAMVNALKSVPEGSGTLLDNTILFATSDCSLGRQHRLADYPLLIAGSGGGTLKPGRHHAGTVDNASEVMHMMATALGIALPSFGQAEGQVTGHSTLSDLVV